MPSSYFISVLKTSSFLIPGGKLSIRDLISLTLCYSLSLSESVAIEINMLLIPIYSYTFGGF